MEFRIMPKSIALFSNNLSRLDGNKVGFSGHLFDEGHQVHICDVNTVEFVSGRFLCQGWLVDRRLQEYEGVDANAEVDLDSMDILWLLNQPAPCLSTDAWSLLFALNQRVPFVNSIASMALANCKAFLPGLLHPDEYPNSTISFRHDRHRAALAAHGRAIIKPPSDGCGNRVFLVAEGDTNRDVIIQALCGGGTGEFIHARSVTGMDRRYAVSQQFLSEGPEHRVILAGGRFIGGYAKAPNDAAQDHRANLCQGGRMLPARFDNRSIARFASIADRLSRIGLNYCGLDVIGDQVIEFNLVDPGGLYTLKKLENDDKHGAAWRCIERALAG
jgi:glutathione synthase